MTAYIKKGGAGRAYTPKKDFAKKEWNSTDKPARFFKATCSKCGQSCEVPFRPVTGKPVFCRDCFVPTGETGAGRAGDKFPRKDYGSKSTSFERPSVASNDEILKQLALVNKNLEKLIQAVQFEGSQTSFKK